MKKTFLILSCFIATHCLAQKQANIWYFGNNLGLDFNFSPPRLLTDGQITYDETANAESASVISDKNGHLIFYTDGKNVWNKNHQVMPNGNGLWGSGTTTQTIAVPKPGDSTTYYIFTASPQGDYDLGGDLDKKGFRYSMVDLKKEGGLGDVVQKNILLSKSTTEKIAATYHRNGKDIWVLMHEWGNNIFRAYLITKNGVDIYPVINSIGTSFLADKNGVIAIGQMKFSPNGKIIAYAVLKGGVEVFNFDSSTAKITQRVSLLNWQDDGVYYGIEFSPNSKFIYVSEQENIYQLNLNALDVKSSIINLNGANAEANSGQLQLGVDGKIYIASVGQFYLGLIEDPDYAGDSAKYNIQGFVLPSINNRACQSGLPNFLSNYFFNPTLYPPDTSEPGFLFDMPNVFTPNNDGLNESFIPLEYTYIQFAILKIFNRWGKEIYQTVDLLTGWDGGNHPTGTYYWEAKYTGVNGKSGHQKGWVQLIR